MNAITPTTPTATVDHDAIRAECLRMKDRLGLDWVKQAKACDVPYGTFTGYVKGTYEGNNDRVGALVQKWLDAREEAATTAALLPDVPKFVETVTARHVMGLFTFAQTAPDIVVMAGGAGIGKTSAAEQYKATHPHVFLATMEPKTGGIHTMLGEVAEVAGVDERSSAKLMRAIGRRLHGIGALLIVDEAQHLQTTALDQLRSLHDKWGIGIALVGNETVHSRLEGEGRKVSLAQLFSRVGMRMNQPRPRAEDVAALTAAWDITDPAMIKTLAGIAGKPGALRGMTKTLKLAVMLAGSAGEPLSDKIIRTAWRQLGNVALD